MLPTDRKLKFARTGEVRQGIATICRHPVNTKACQISDHNEVPPNQTILVNERSVILLKHVSCTSGADHYLTEQYSRS